MSRKSTPVSVRCARWAAIAAAITAFGSIFNTMWSERPWWREEPAKMVSPVTTSASEEPRMLMMTEVSSPEKFSWSKWILVGSVVILVGAGTREIIHRWKDKQ